MMTHLTYVFMAVIALAGTALAQGSAPARPGAAGPAGQTVGQQPNPLAAARSWAYQLQKPSPGEIALSPFDVAVIDYSRNGTDDKRFRPADLKWMKRKPDGGRRIVLAYMSLGEAEDYRFYWDEKWIETATPDEPAPAAPPIPSLPQAPGAAPTTPPSPPPAQSATGTAAAPPIAAAPPPVSGTPPIAGSTQPPAPSAKPDRWISKLAPPWLGDENERWSGNFQVKYWEKDWQDIIFGKPSSYLERIIAAGFDGVYLDRVDAFYEFQDARGTAAAEMVGFVQRLSAHAKRLKPGFLIVPQNGEELLLDPTYLAAIDAIAKEDLFFGGPGNGQPNHSAVIANSLAWLAAAEPRKLPVFVVEYLDKPEQIRQARGLIEARGFVPYFTDRDLDHLTMPLPPVAAPAAPVAAPKPPRAAKARTPAKVKRSN